MRAGTDLRKSLYLYYSDRDQPVSETGTALAGLFQPPLVVRKDLATGR
jgi:hypothetical protein